MPNNRVSSVITETPSLELLKSALKEANSDTLVLFDVDHVLIIPTQEYNIHGHKSRKLLWKEFRKKLPEDKVDFLESIILASAEWTYVDNGIVEVFKYLKKHSIPTVALTALGTSKFGIIEKTEDWRIEELQKVGICFEDMSPLKGNVLTKGFKSDFGVPMIKDGIIFTSELEKGPILEYILSHYNYFPKEIIFVDDLIENIESVKIVCEKLKIKYHGFHYTAVAEMHHAPIDAKKEELRFKILENEHIWLTDEELLKRASS